MGGSRRVCKDPYRLHRSALVQAVLEGSYRFKEGWEGSGRVKKDLGGSRRVREGQEGFEQA